MRTRSLFISLLMVFCVSFFPTLCLSQHSEFIRTEKQQNLDAKVDSYIKPYLEMGCFSGSVLIAKGGKILFSKSYGMANYELNVQNTSKTKFHIASLTKSFTAAAIMILQERGALSVNDLLNKFIPDFPNGNKITIHHLLTHTGGLARDLPDFNDKWAVPHTLEQLVAIIKKTPHIAEPDGVYRYSNNDYRLLAYIVEKVSGKSYGQFLKENIFDPLDMQDTGHDGNAGMLLKNRANGYAPAGKISFENAPLLDWTTKTGNGSLYSTVEDLYKWDRALYTEKILPKSAIEKIYQNQYGWFVGERFNRRVVRYNGNSPGFNADFQRYINDDVTIILLSNNYAAVSTMIGTSLAAIVFNAPYSAPNVEKIQNVDGKALEPYVGRYQGDANFYFPNIFVTIENKGDSLLMQWGSGVNAPLAPQSKDNFLDRRFWATVVFEKDAQGNVTRLIWRYDGRNYVANKLKTN